MRATEIIRNVLDIIDEIEVGSDSLEISAIAEPLPSREVDDNTRRFKHILDLVSTPKSSDDVVNRPDVKVAVIDAVTIDAGGGMHSPKQAIDIKGTHPIMFPFIRGISKE